VNADTKPECSDDMCAAVVCQSPHLFLAYAAGIAHRNGGPPAACHPLTGCTTVPGLRQQQHRMAFCCHWCVPSSTCRGSLAAGWKGGRSRRGRCQAVPWSSSCPILQPGDALRLWCPCRPMQQLDGAVASRGSKGGPECGSADRSLGIDHSDHYQACRADCAVSMQFRMPYKCSQAEVDA